MTPCAQRYAMITRNTKNQTPNTKWFDKLTTLSQVEGHKLYE